MSAPTPPAPGETKTFAGDTVTAIAREGRPPLYEVRGREGLRMSHWSWEAICQCCWGWVATTLSGLAAARDWHARRFGRDRESFHIDGVDLRIESWAIVSNWHVALFLDGGRRVEVDRSDNIVADSANAGRPAPPASSPSLPTVSIPDPDPRQTRAVLSGDMPSPQLSLFGGAA